MSLFKRAQIAPLEYTRRLWMRAWIAATLFFLYAPLLVLIAFSVAYAALTLFTFVQALQGRPFVSF